LIEEAAFVPGLAVRVEMFDRKEPGFRGSCALARIGVDMAATGACTTIASRGSGQLQDTSAASATTGISAVFHLVEIATAGTNQNISRMAFILGQQVAGKQIDPLPAGLAGEDLHPDKTRARNSVPGLRVNHL